MCIRSWCGNERSYEGLDTIGRIAVQTQHPHTPPTRHKRSSSLNKLQIARVRVQSTNRPCRHPSSKWSTQRCKVEVPCVSVRCYTMFRLEQEDQGIRRLSPNAVQTRGLPASCAQRYEVHILHVPGCSSTRERLIVPGFCFLHYRSHLHTYTSNEKRIREWKPFVCCLPPFSLSHHPPTSSPDIFS